MYVHVYVYSAVLLRYCFLFLYSLFTRIFIIFSDTRSGRVEGIVNRLRAKEMIKKLHYVTSAA